jgi:protoporphyrinogen IX oxidase
MLWFKAFHIVGVVSWFAGLLYLPRLFVYHSQIQGAQIQNGGPLDDDVGNARFKIMERKLFFIMSIGAGVALAFGVAMLVVVPEYLQMRWLYAKLALVLVLIGYHGACFALLEQFAADRNARAERWYRLFNEVPALVLIGIVLLVVLKPALGT